jgi:3-hydroxy-9,10-secoandrosta-1,3,5(10)-triene-9,17-dione monooxygenase
MTVQKAEPTTTVVRPDRTDLVARAVALQPLLREYAGEMDERRYVVDEVNAALVEAGMFRLMRPQRLGGYETDLRTAVEVIIALGESDGSAAWLVGIGIGADWILGRTSVHAQDAVFGNPEARLAGGFAPATARLVDGGVWITGRWPCASGSRHATWASVSAMVHGDGGDVVDILLGTVPVSELGLEDTWRTVGMRATGSNTFVGTEIFVPKHMLLSVSALLAGTYPAASGEPMYRLPLSVVASLTLVAPIIGIGRAALSFVVEHAASKPVAQTTYVRQSDSVGVQIQIAEAAMKLKTAQLHLYDGADEVDAIMARGEDFDYELRALTRARVGYAAQQVLEAIQILVNAHGAGSFAESSRMQQYWRDANTAARHAGLNAMIGYEVYGRALMCIEETVAQLV